MSAAARPKRWGVSRQAQGQKIDPTNLKFELFTLLAGRTFKITWSDLGRQKEKEMMSIIGLHIGTIQNWSQLLTL
jgi:hypothetical protein